MLLIASVAWRAALLLFSLDRSVTAGVEYREKGNLKEI